MCHPYFDTVDSLPASFGPHADAILSDLPDETNVEPVIRIGEGRT
jgi:hypothetical protein